MSQWGEKTQQKLANSQVVVVGAGALGTNTVNGLARAGVGSITLIDRDFIELSNLHRTSLFGENDLGRPKAIVVKEKITRINSDVTLEALTKDLDPSNALKILEGHGLILDCTDNLLTRYLINDCSVKLSIPWIYAAVIETQGMTMNINPQTGPCFRCLFPDRPPAGSLPTCESAGVIGTIPLVISSIQVTEAIKYLSGENWEVGSLVNFDIWSRDLSTVRIEKNEGCIACGGKKFEFLERELGQTTTSVCGREAVQINPHTEEGVNLDELAEKLSESREHQLTKPILRFKVEDFRVTVFEDGRAIIEGTEEEKVARSIYSKYIGN